MTTWRVVRELKARGSKPGEFFNCRGICISHTTGNIMIADINNKRIQILNEKESFQQQWPVSINNMRLCPLDVHRVNNDVIIAAIEGHAALWRCPDVKDYDGTPAELIHTFGNDEFVFPRSVLADDANLYVTDAGKHRLTSHDMEGRLRRSVGSVGKGDTNFNWPYYMCIDGEGRIGVSDSHNTVVKLFDRDLNFISSFGAGHFTCCCGIAYSASEGGYFIVGDYDTNSILKFSKDGKFIEYVDQRTDLNLSSLDISRNDDLYVSIGDGFRVYSKA